MFTDGSYKNVEKLLYSDMISAEIGSVYMNNIICMYKIAIYTTRNEQYK